MITYIHLGGEEYSLRPERATDSDTIYDMIKTAFATAKVGDGTEQDFAAALREGKEYIPELALVVEHEGGIVAHIMMTRTYVMLPGGGRYEGLLLAPVSVSVEHRNRGLGSMLIREAMRHALSMGWEAVFLCGDPAYYNRFGFRPAVGFGLEPQMDIPMQYVLATELRSGALDGITGTVDYC